MKRKTNLFYTSGDDSNFITFSNYGESMTGNFLATDWKLFPSRFICMYVKYLDPEYIEDNFISAKQRFIRYIASYYENKVAFLRDKLLQNNEDVESTMFLLNYLLEAIYRIDCENLNTSYIEQIDYKDIQGNTDDIYISFINDITEQDYNGIYTDIITVINSSDKKIGNIIVDQDKIKNAIVYDIPEPDSNHLYGWTETGEYVGPQVYDQCRPIFDKQDNKEYYTSSVITGIDMTPDSDIQTENIKFNIIIPLFDLVNNNSNTNDDIIDESISNNIDLSSIYTGYISDVPLGIWISDNVIELKRNNETGYCPSWSLLLSGQFKPFPYSAKMPNEITQDNTKDAFATYSQVLMRQNKLLDKLETISTDITYLSNRISKIENDLRNTYTKVNFDKLHNEMLNFKHYQENNFNSFKEEMYAYISNNWKGYIS